MLADKITSYLRTNRATAWQKRNHSVMWSTLSLSSTGITLGSIIGKTISMREFVVGAA
jgi:hypothetical protein